MRRTAIDSRRDWRKLWAWVWNMKRASATANPWREQLVSLCDERGSPIDITPGRIGDRT